jgi:hypothetical protein
MWQLFYSGAGPKLWFFWGRVSKDGKLELGRALQVSASNLEILGWLDANTQCHDMKWQHFLRDLCKETVEVWNRLPGAGCHGESARRKLTMQGARWVHTIPICKQDDGCSWCRWVVGARWSLEKHFLINWATKENAAFPGMHANWEPCWCNFGSAAARSTWELKIANVDKMKWSGPKGIMERWRLNQCLGFGELCLFKKHTHSRKCATWLFFI